MAEMTLQLDFLYSCIFTCSLITLCVKRISINNPPFFLNPKSCFTVFILSFVVKVVSYGWQLHSREKMITNSNSKSLGVKYKTGDRSAHYLLVLSLAATSLTLITVNKA